MVDNYFSRYSNTGNLYFRGSRWYSFFSDLTMLNDALVLKPDGAVELYYDNSKNFETSSDLLMAWTAT